VKAVTSTAVVHAGLAALVRHVDQVAGVAPTRNLARVAGNNRTLLKRLGLKVIDA